MKKISYPLTLLLLFGLLLLPRTQVRGQEAISPDKVQEDFEILQDIAVGISPKMTREDSLRIVKQFKENAGLLGDQPMTAIDFVRVFSEMNLETQFDEHARLELEAQVMMPFLTSNKLFPLAVYMCGQKLMINNNSPLLPYGTIIHSVNGVPTSELLPKLTKDFENTFSRKRIEEQFALVYLIKFGHAEVFQVEYSLPSSPEKIKTKDLEGADFQSWQANMQSVVRPYRQKELIVTEYVEDENTFFLQLNSFSMGEEDGKGLFNSLKSEHKKFKGELKKAFKELEKSGADRLIIDLRYNKGGNIRVPGILYSYIATEPFIEQAYLEIPDFDIPHKNLIKKVGNAPIEKTKEVDQFLKHWEAGFDKSGEGYSWEFIEKNNHKPAKNAFTGKVYLLVGGRSISASSYFTALFKSQNRGVIIGEELGGSHHSITAGTSVSYQLPNTSISVITPLMVVSFSDELYSAVPEEKVVPDIVLTDDERYQLLMDQREPELERAFQSFSTEK